MFKRLVIATLIVLAVLVAPIGAKSVPVSEAGVIPCGTC